LVSQYSTGSTLESKLLMLSGHSIESRATNEGAGARGLFANPAKTHHLVDSRNNFAPRELTQGGTLQIPSRFPVAVLGPEISSESAGRTSTLYATSGGNQHGTN